MPRVTRSRTSGAAPAASTAASTPRKTATPAGAKAKSKSVSKASPKVKKEAEAEPTQLSSPPATPVTKSAKAGKLTGTGRKIKKEPASAPPTLKSSTTQRKRGVPAVKDEEDDEKPAKRARVSKSKKAKDENAEIDVKVEAEAEAALASNLKNNAKSPAKGGKKSKASGYGLTGQSPFPDYPHPTHEECHEVVRLLSKAHGEVKAPPAVRVPSLTNAGCGDVPSVLDAVVRTRLSAATTNLNSSRAFQGLVSTFGVVKEGEGKGSVDWDAVRLAPQKKVFGAIQCGGLADVKSKDIQKILQMVYDEGHTSKDGKVVLSLDHLHNMPSEEAFQELIKYPGIGPKTASCVLLFCLQRPSFAVDTHVFRLCRWLGWVPRNDKRTTRETTYAHCDVRVPDDLKRPLHTLLIKHGKLCPRCRAATGTGSEGWKKGCPIEHLVKRDGVKKGGKAKGWDSDEEDAGSESESDGWSGGSGSD